MLAIAQKNKLYQQALKYLSEKIQLQTDKHQTVIESQTNDLVLAISIGEALGEPKKATASKDNKSKLVVETQIQEEQPLSINVDELDRAFTPPTQKQMQIWQSALDDALKACESCPSRVGQEDRNLLEQATFALKVFFGYRQKSNLGSEEELAHIQGTVHILQNIVKNLDKKEKLTSRINNAKNIYDLLDVILDFSVFHASNTMYSIVQQYWSVVKIDPKAIIKLPPIPKYDAHALGELVRWIKSPKPVNASVTTMPTKLYKYIADQIKDVVRPMNTQTLLHDLEQVILSPEFLQKYLMVRGVNPKGIIEIKDVCRDILLLNSTNTKENPVNDYSVLSNFYKVFYPKPPQAQKGQPEYRLQAQALERHAKCQEDWLKSILVEIACIKILQSPYAQATDQSVKFTTLNDLRSSTIEALKCVSVQDDTDSNTAFATAQASLLEVFEKLVPQKGLGKLGGKLKYLAEQRNLAILKLGKNPTQQQLNPVHIAHNKLLLIFLYSVD